MAKIDDCDCWDELVEMAKQALCDCPFCHGAGREVRLEPKGQTWLGMGYSPPQFWELRHFCTKPEDDAFVDGHIVLRVRHLDDAVLRWNESNKR